MRHNNKYGWTDLGEKQYLHPPNVVLRTLDIDSYRKIVEDCDLLQAGQGRHVIYETAAGVRHVYELVPYQHPAGAAVLVLGTLATAATGVVTYTPTTEGRGITETGVLTPAAAVSVADIAGYLLTDYYYHLDDPLDQYESHRVTQLNVGDFCWLLRRGQMELDTTAGVNDEQVVIASATVAGEVQDAPTIDTTSAVTLNSTLQQNMLGDANPAFFGVGVAKETTGAAGLADILVLLPPRLIRTF